ncbi:MAG: hypothetical protein ACTHL8_18960 [Burkholderiaceae bacterium]
MPITCTEIASVGEALCSQGGEAAERSGVSRLYYGALHRAIAWKNATPGMPSVGGVGGTHAQLQYSLKNLDPMAAPAQKTKGRVLAAKLGALKVRRTTADYDLAASLTSCEVQAQRAETAAFIASCDASP